MKFNKKSFCFSTFCILLLFAYIMERKVRVIWESGFHILFCFKAINNICWFLSKSLFQVLLIGIVIKFWVRYIFHIINTLRKVSLDHLGKLQESYYSLSLILEKKLNIVAIIHQFIEYFKVSRLNRQYSW